MRQEGYRTPVHDGRAGLTKRLLKSYRGPLSAVGLPTSGELKHVESPGDEIILIPARDSLGKLAVFQPEKRFGEDQSGDQPGATSGKDERDRPTHAVANNLCVRNTKEIEHISDDIGVHLDSRWPGVRCGAVPKAGKIDEESR